MEALVNRINSIVNNLNLLFDKYDQLKHENDSLKKENSELKDRIEKQNVILDQLGEKVKTLQIARGEAGGGDRKDLKLKINEYIREIDKCIAMLNN